MDETETEKAVMVNIVEDSKQLYFIFGGIAAGMGIPPFEFSKASNILGENRIFVRDLKQNWYNTGLPNISSNIDQTRSYLESLIEEHSPESVIMIGNSMGGFAALLFSSMIKNTRAIAFAPQTFISPRKRFFAKDYRWLKEIAKTYLMCWNKKKVWDLSSLSPVKGWQATVLVSSTCELDMAHARNVQNMKGVDVVEFDFGGHSLVKSLRDRGELAKYLTRNDREN